MAIILEEIMVNWVISEERDTKIAIKTGEVINFKALFRVCLDRETLDLTLISSEWTI
jgi:hypothetical protein